MRHQLSLRLICASLVLHFSTAKDQSILSDLGTHFHSGATQLQISYTGRAGDGFESGSKLTSQQTLTAPTFTLNSSTAISPDLRYTIALLDTSCDSHQTLHFFQTDLAQSHPGTAQLASPVAPLIAYQAPGSFQETGSSRRYNYLLYVQRGPVDKTKVPAAGSKVDVPDLQKKLGLQSPIADVSIFVDLGGDVVCSSAASAAAPELVGGPVATPTTRGLGMAKPSVLATTVLTAVQSRESNGVNGTGGSAAGMAGRTAGTTMTLTLATTESPTKVRPAATKTTIHEPSLKSHMFGLIKSTLLAALVPLVIAAALPFCEFILE